MNLQIKMNNLYLLLTHIKCQIFHTYVYIYIQCMTIDLSLTHNIDL
jgi:hypothetical protein